MLLRRLDARKFVILLLVGTFLLTLPGSALLRNVYANPTPTLQVTPSYSNVTFGSYFNVNVSVANIVNLTCWEFRLYYLNTVVNCAGITEGPFLKSSGGHTTLTIYSLNNNYNSTYGRVWAYCYIRGSYNVSGSGNLAQVAFEAIGAGDTPLILADTVLGDTQIPTQNIPHTDVNGEVHVVVPPVSPVSGMVGITGYTLVFKATMNNSLGSQEIIDYNWNFSVDKWNGTQWVASDINGSSAPAVVITGGFTTVDLPYYVYVLNSSGPNAVAWGDWLRISYTFNWTYGGPTYAVVYVAELNVHPGDISGAASVAFPYLGADLLVNSKDFGAIAANWLATVPLGTNPTSLLARADINGDGTVNSKDIGPIAVNWLATWTNTPPT